MKKVERIRSFFQQPSCSVTRGESHRLLLTADKHDSSMWVLFFASTWIAKRIITKQVASSLYGLKTTLEYQILHRLHYTLKRRASQFKGLLTLQPRAVRQTINGVLLPFIFSKYLSFTASYYGNSMSNQPCNLSPRKNTFGCCFTDFCLLANLISMDFTAVGVVHCKEGCFQYSPSIEV